MVSGIKKISLLLFLLGMCYGVKAADFDITRFGAVGDGTTLNSQAIQKAIDACHQSGGGKVIIPAGKFLSGTIALKDNVTIYLQKDAVLLGSVDLKDYQNLDPFTEGLGIDVGWALLVAVDAKNIGIEGEGTIDGQGSAIKAKHILTDTRPEGQRWGLRPFLVRIVRCTGVTVRGVTLKYAGAWTSHYFQSRQILIENVKIQSVGVAHNDGIGIDGCQQVRIKDCDVTSGDDALVFKTTSRLMACKDIEVSGLRLKSNQAGIKIGTESIADFENIKITNCHIYDTKNGGIKLLTVDGAHISNVLISDITMDEVRTPMLFRLGSRLNVFRKNTETKKTTGSFENVTIRNVKAKAADNAQLTPPSGILITGVPGHDITNLTLENIEITLAGGGTTEDSRVAVPEAIDQYPEVKTFGPKIPAYGIWARHVKGLKLINVKFNLASNDRRPALVCDDGKELTVSNWDLPTTTGAEAIVRLESVAGANISGISIKGDARALVRVEGTNSKSISVANNKASTIKKQVEFASGAKPK
ncbi:glycosyl hydrolase family 28 protein [Pedobacter sp. KR3-3]|uniref:Glycosyl hydrolase family 28 protein n=1 Tax=Pedobacter albus TaxID=3113905 RepID=A0ABU7I747_9SPHI|nr:glycosyl hydrolase family 28 protein [Pedobacter sp. KR3-3]MEE1945286.1 glycosyl hydrolase family 28 protein [Pedobacter sp. KR3-3]